MTQLVQRFSPTEPMSAGGVGTWGAWALVLAVVGILLVGAATAQAERSGSADLPAGGDGWAERWVVPPLDTGYFVDVGDTGSP